MTEGTGAGGQFVRVLGVAGAAVKDVAGYAISAGRFVGELVQDFRSGQPAAVALGVALTGLVTGFAAFKILTGVVGGFKALRGAILGVNLVMMANPVVLVIAALIGLGAAMYVAYQKVEWFRNGVNAVFGFIKQYWPVMLGVITGGIGPAVVYVIRNWDRIVSFVKACLARSARRPAACGTASRMPSAARSTGSLRSGTGSRSALGRSRSRARCRISRRWRSARPTFRCSPRAATSPAPGA